MLRKSKANERKHLFLTGGGPATNTTETPDPILDQLTDVMGVGLEGLPAR